MPTVGVDDRRSPPYLPPATAEQQELELLLIEKARKLVLKSDGIGNGDGDNDAGGFSNSGVLPLRPYAGDCPHYVRTATCKFGPSCVYNHPVRKIHQVFNGGGSVFDKSGRIECKYFSTAGGCRYGKSCRYSHPGGESEVTHPQLNQLGLPPRMASSYLPRTGNSYSATNTDGSLWKLDFPVNVDEFPERPGEPDCDYFMKTGNCKFKSTCRFHHPKNRPDELVLNENGLPLRPGKSVCWHYERHGRCKFGRACLFDHSAVHGLSTYPQWNSLKNVVAAAAADDDDGCNGGGWDD